MFEVGVGVMVLGIILILGVLVASYFLFRKFEVLFKSKGRGGEAKVIEMEQTRKH